MGMGGAAELGVDAVPINRCLTGLHRTKVAGNNYHRDCS
jgi:hypothetical protein